ncbi:MAG TPA: hypothetical protein VFO59_07625 [Dehalococcoidia bacterium]|nr:hypothetical protein [Dehalococcoidia bacterium]
MFRGALIVALITTGLLALACSSDDDEAATGSPETEDASRSESVGGIEVEATWLTADGDIGEGLDAYSLDEFLLVEVKLDTHSGDLGTIDIESSSRLETSVGTVEPEAWVASSDDAHHRAGVLVFERDESAGPVRLIIELDDGTAELAWDSPPG